MSYDHTIASFDLSFEPNHEAASTARQQARRALDEAGVPLRVAADVELIIAELASNAVEQNPDPAIVLTMEITSDAVAIAVSNHVAGDHSIPVFETVGPVVDTERLSDSGRGLGIVAALGDEIGITTEENWTSVSVRCRI